MDPTPHSEPAGPVRDEAVASRAPASQDRRALLRAGVGASPVLLSLVSRPVLAGGTCTVASSFVSAATWRSHNPTATSPQCTTRTCEDWLAEAMLPTRSAALTKTVGALLGSTFSPYNNSVAFQLLINGGLGISKSGELGVAQHLICLSLNSANSSYMPAPGGVTTAYISGIWVNYKTNLNTYKPGSGLTWDSNQLISWARMLMYPSAV